MDSSHAWEESITHKQNKQYSTFFFSDICRTVIQMYIEKIIVVIMSGNSVSTFGNLVQIFIIFKTWLLLINGESWATFLEYKCSYTSITNFL